MQAIKPAEADGSLGELPEGLQIGWSVNQINFEEDYMREKIYGKRISQGSFFARMKNKAAEYLNNPDKLNQLIEKAKNKAESKKQGPLKEVLDSLMALLRLVRAYAKREYLEVPWQSLLLIVATILYFLLPTDVIPDWILGLGYIDDAALIGWTMNTMKSDIDGFREWESRKSDG